MPDLFYTALKILKGLLYLLESSINVLFFWGSKLDFEVLSFNSHIKIEFVLSTLQSTNHVFLCVFIKDSHQEIVSTLYNNLTQIRERMFLTVSSDFNVIKDVGRGSAWFNLLKCFFEFIDCDSQLTISVLLDWVDIFPFELCMDLLLLFLLFLCFLVFLCLLCERVLWNYDQSSLHGLCLPQSNRHRSGER